MSDNKVDAENQVRVAADTGPAAGATPAAAPADPADVTPALAAKGEAPPVPDSTPVARSPIPAIAPVLVEAGWEVSGLRSEAALTITDCTPLAKVHVRAPWNGTFAKALGVPFGRAARDLAGPLAGAGLLVGAGPGEWLLLGPPGTAEKAAGQLADLVAGSAPDEFVSVIDLTHGRALVRMTGGSAADLLARLCPVDLDGEMTPDGTAFRAPVAGISTDVVRDDRDGTPSYLLHCERSSGRYLFDTLMAAGGELGIGVDGFMTPGI